MSVKYHGVVVPESTDLADGPKAFRDLTDFGNAMPIFATLAERDGWTSPPDGALCTVLKSSGVAANTVMQFISGSGWKTLETPTIGIIEMWPTATPPANYLLCNGQAVPAGSDYDQLRAIVGANVPNLVDKFVLGSGVKAINATGGAATVTLATNQMPVHNHFTNTGLQSANHSHGGTTGTESTNHSHGLPSEMVRNVSGLLVPNTAVPGYNYTPSTGLFTDNQSVLHTHGFTTGGVSADHTHAITNDGGGQAHENMPPYVVMAYIIRAK